MARLEEISARYSTLTDLLNDPSGLREYRESMKSYLGEGESFDPVFSEFVRQIKDAATQVPGFKEKAWEVNPLWKQQSVVFKGEASGSALQLKREAMGRAVKAMEEEARHQGASIVGNSATDSTKLNRLVEEVRVEYGLLSPLEVKNLTSGQRRDYNAKLQGISNDPRMVAISSYLMSELFHTDERLSDALHSGDADIVFAEISKMEKPIRYKEAILRGRPEFPEFLLAYLKFNSPTRQNLFDTYQQGIKSTKDFQHIPTPRLDPELLARLQALQAQGVPPEDLTKHLTFSERQKYQAWQANSKKVMDEKQAFANLHNNANSYFFYDLHRDEVKGTLRLKSESGMELKLVPTPRPFHAFFAGRKKGECVGGRDVGGLTPRRWARAALQGAATLFTETGDGKMEGYVGLTPLVHETNGTRYDVVDIMSHAIKGDTLTTEDGRPVKFSFFDIFVDRYPIPPGSRGFVIGNGTAVSMNVGAGEVVENSPSYRQGPVVGKPSEFRAPDSLAREISTRYPTGNYPGGMIYDGMKSDGTKLVHLLTRAERPKLTGKDIERLVVEQLLKKGALTDRDAVWKIAMENRVRMEVPSYYSTTDFTHHLAGILLEQTRRTEPLTGQDAKYLAQLSQYLGTKTIDEEVRTKILNEIKNGPGPLENRGFLLGAVLPATSAETIASVQDAWLNHLISQDPSTVSREVLESMRRLFERSTERGLNSPPRHFDQTVFALVRWREWLNTNRFEFDNEVQTGKEIRSNLSRIPVVELFSLEGVGGDLHADGVVRALLDLGIPQALRESFLLNAVRHLRQQPKLLDELIEHFFIRTGDFASLSVINHWLQNEKHEVSPRAARIIRQTVDDRLGLVKSGLAWFESAFAGSSAREGGRALASARRSQLNDLRRHRLLEFKVRWQELKQGTGFISRTARRIRANCGEAFGSILRF